MRFILCLALSLTASAAFGGVDTSTQGRLSAAQTNLGTSNVVLGTQVSAAPINPYTAVYGAQFFFDSSSNSSRRIAVLDSSSQFNPTCLNVPAGVIAYQPQGGGMIYSLSPNPSIAASAPQLWKIDPITCGYTALTAGSPFGGTVTSANFSPDGRLWFAGPGVLYQVATDTGNIISQTTLTAGASSAAVAISFDQTGAFYLTASDQLYTWSHVPNVSPAPSPAVTTNLTALLPSGSTYGQSVGMTFGNLGSLLLYALQTNSGGSSTSYAGFTYTPSTGTIAQSGTVFGSNTGLYSASSFPSVANLSLSMTLQHVGQINPGDLLTWAITLNNAGPGDAVNGNFAVVLPSGLSFVSAQVFASDRNCSGPATDAATIICNFSIGAGQVQTLTIDTQVDAGFTSGVQTNYAEVMVSPFSTIAVPGNDSGKPGSGHPHEPDDAEVTYVVGPNSHLASSMSGSPFNVWQGSTVTYTIQASNSGPNSAPHAKIFDTLPAGLTPQSANGSGWSCSIASQVVTCTNPLMAVSQTATITIVASGDTPGTYNNTCTASSDYIDPSPSTTCSAQTIVKALPTSAPPVVPARNGDQSCPVQFTGNLALKELDYSFAPSVSIGGVATVTYPTAVYMEGGEFACYTNPSDVSTKVPMPLCTFDQAAGTNFQTTCPITTPGAVSMCAFRGYFRSYAGGHTYPLTFNVTLYGQPNTSATTNLPMEVVDATDYVFTYDFESRQRPDQPTQNCQFQ